MTEPLRCRRCRHKPIELTKNWQVVCVGIQGNEHDGPEADTPAAAIADWNREQGEGE